VNFTNFQWLSDSRGGSDWFSGLLDTLTHNSWLQITVTHRLVFLVRVFTLLLCSGFKQRTFAFLWVTKLCLASATATPLPTVPPLLCAHISYWFWYCCSLTQWLPSNRLFLELFPNSGGLCWLHNSGLHQACHSAFFKTHNPVCSTTFQISSVQTVLNPVNFK
jgi:hypothetical protein